MTKLSYNQEIAHLGLGQPTQYKENYDAGLLQAVPRSLGRNEIGLGVTLPFSGEDLWNGYEFSYLNCKGKPCVALLQCRVPATSPNLVESKSFKLYLNSFNQSHFASEGEVLLKLEKDLSRCAGEQVKVALFPLSTGNPFEIAKLAHTCIDELDIEVQYYSPRPGLLETGTERVEERLVSHLLKSNCLITNQPDWGSLVINYQGNRINHEALLKYIVSFRQHNEFHEQCVERIFCDILTRCEPEKLTVCARYTRRGGLDINPFRSNFEHPYENLRLIRQ